MRVKQVEPQTETTALLNCPVSLCLTDCNCWSHRCGPTVGYKLGNDTTKPLLQ